LKVRNKIIKVVGMITICLSLALNVYWLRSVYIQKHPNMNLVYSYYDFNSYLRTASYFLEFQLQKEGKDKAQAIYDTFHNVQVAGANQGKFEPLLELTRQHFRYLSEHLPKEINNPKELKKIQVIIEEFSKVYCDDRGIIKPS
jgi:hypothetical protein